MSDQRVQGGSDLADQRRPFLTTALATSGQKRVALGIAAATFIVAAGIVPFARVQLHPMHAFDPAYGAALVFIDLITALLLFDQVMRLRTGGMLLLASGYLFCALITVAHALTYPDVFAPTGLLGAREQTTAWIHVFWHAGFSLFVLGYAFWEWRGASHAAPWTELEARRAIVLATVAVAALAASLVLLAIVGHDLLPVVIHGNDYSLLTTKGIGPAMWALTLVALVALWRRALRKIHLWLMLVVWASLLDITLSAVLGSSRYDLGHYAGQIFGLIAASVLLVMLIIETIRLYSGALSDAASAEQKLAQWVRSEAAEELPGARRKAIRDLEAYVLRENIARYRNMLKSTTQPDGQRQTIVKLLAEEEVKHRAVRGGNAGE